MHIVCSVFLFRCQQLSKNGTPLIFSSSVDGTSRTALDGKHGQIVALSTTIINILTALCCLPSWMKDTSLYTSTLGSTAGYPMTATSAPALYHQPWNHTSYIFHLIINCQGLIHRDRPVSAYNFLTNRSYCPWCPIGWLKNAILWFCK